MYVLYYHVLLLHTRVPVLHTSILSFFLQFTTCHGMYKILYRYQYQQLVHQILQLTDSIVSKNNKLVQLFEIDVFGFGSTCHVRIIHVHLHECIFEEKTAGQLTCTPSWYWYTIQCVHTSTGTCIQKATQELQIGPFWTPESTKKVVSNATKYLYRSKGTVHVHGPHYKISIFSIHYLSNKYILNKYF